MPNARYNMHDEGSAQNIIKSMQHHGYTYGKGDAFVNNVVSLSASHKASSQNRARWAPSPWNISLLAPATCVSLRSALLSARQSLTAKRSKFHGKIRSLFSIAKIALVATCAILLFFLPLKPPRPVPTLFPGSLQHRKGPPIGMGESFYGSPPNFS